MAKVNIKSEKITPFGGIYNASKAFYALSLDKVIKVCLPLYRRMRQMYKDGKKMDGTPSDTIFAFLMLNSKRIRDASIYMSKKYRSSFYS